MMQAMITPIAARKWLAMGAMALAICLQPAAHAQTQLVFEASRDAALYEDPTNDLANGAGQHLFAGLTGVNTGVPLLRRSLLAFDLTSVPANSIVTEVSVTLALNRDPIPPNPPVELRLHRTLASWTEGPTDALGPEGAGAIAQAGDVTWRHRSFPGSLWNTEGGDFQATASATVPADMPDIYTFSTTPELVADVQAWLDDPSSNHGWMLTADEVNQANARRFDSRQGNDPFAAPQMTITFIQGAPPEPEVIPALSGWALFLLGLGLFAIPTLRRKHRC